MEGSKDDPSEILKTDWLFFGLLNKLENWTEFLQTQSQKPKRSFEKFNLNFQDNCPMCHEKLYRIDATSQTEFQQDLPPNQNNDVQNNEPPNADNIIDPANEIEE